MNTHTFDNHYLTCPLCHRHANPHRVKACVGLFSCPYCQEKFVVSASGNYVRDPFVLKQITLATTLRRQSHPLARLIRDFIFIKRPFVSFFVGILVIMATLTVMQQSTSTNIEPVSSNQEKTLDKK